jgi:hypothetical protein
MRSKTQRREGAIVEWAALVVNDGGALRLVRTGNDSIYFHASPGQFVDDHVKGGSIEDLVDHPESGRLAIEGRNLQRNASCILTPAEQSIRIGRAHRVQLFVQPFPKTRLVIKHQLRNQTNVKPSFLEGTTCWRNNNEHVITNLQLAICQATAPLHRESEGRGEAYDNSAYDGHL